MAPNASKEKRYSGLFNYCGQMIPGEISYNKENGYINLRLTQLFETLDDYCETEFAEREESEQKRIRTIRFPYISGTLHTNEKVALFNCRRYSNVCDGSVRTLKFRADYLIFDEIVEENPRYSSFTFTVENALLWGGVTQVADISSKGNPNRNFCFKNHDDSKTYFWGDTNVEFSTHLDYSDLTKSERSERCEITEYLKVQLTPQNGDKPVAYFLELRDHILAMISFAIKDAVNIVSQYFYKEDDYFDYETSTGEIARDYTGFPIITKEKRQYLIKRLPKEYNFFLEDLPPEKDLGEAIDKLSPVFDLYASFFRYCRLSP